MSSETAAQIAREAKGIHQGLKELLKTHSPWDKEVEFNRKNLRRLYLRLLLVEPYAKESKDAETHLWMQTSYQFISLYKQNVSTLERALQQQGRPPRRHVPQDQSSDQQQDQRKHGPVEYRKLMQRFRQFLAEEEKFWIRFVARYHRQFNISEARAVLIELGEVSATVNIRIPELGDTGEDGAAGPAVTNSDINENTSAGNGATRPPRDHFGFPPEDTVALHPPPDVDEAERRAAGLAIITKALVCLGDIARYRELYNESGGRPKAGHEDGSGAGPARRGRNRRGGPNGSELGQVTRARTYNRSISLYEHARALLPSDGNAAHQLAILAFYGGDIFHALYWYWRALCVKVPYEAAVENVRKVLARAATEGASRWSGQAVRGEGEEEVLVRKVEQMKENITFLHALLRVGAQRLNVSADDLASHVAQSFKSLVSERALPTEMVTRVVVLAQGALWKHRMIRDISKAPSFPQISKPPERDRRSRLRAQSMGMDGIDEEMSGPNLDDTIIDTPIAIESRLFMHLLSLHRVLFEVGAAQLATPPPSDASENDLAPRITANFRRMLPALRVASKWMIGNASYIIKVLSAAPREADFNDARGGEIENAQHGGVTLFFVRFTEFYTALGKVFPFEKLPMLEAPLDEDVDLRGFLPLRGKMIGDDNGNGGGQVIHSSAVEGATKQNSGKHRAGAYAPTRAAEKVHPNEEQLMRIWDLLTDAKALTKVKGFPVRMEDSAFLLDDGRITVGTKSTSFVAPAPTATSPLLNITISPQSSDERHRPVHGLRQPHGHRDLAQHVLTSDQEQEDDVGTDAGRTDDDPVGDAFREVLDNRALSGSEPDGDEDGDQIVWNPRPITSPPKTVMPTTPVLPETITADARTIKEPPKEPIAIETPSLSSAALSSSFNRAVASSKPKLPSAAAGTTAQDLLNSVMALGGSRNGFAGGFGASAGLGLSPRLTPGAVPLQQPPSFLFGSGLPSSPLSIWSTSLDQEHPTVHLHHKSTESSQGIGSGISLGEHNRPSAHTHSSAHGHALSVSTPSAGLAPVWSPSFTGGALHHSLGTKIGTSSAELPLTPHMHPPIHSSDAQHVPQSFQTIRGPGPSHHRTLSLNLSGSTQAVQQTMAHRISPYGPPGMSPSTGGSISSGSSLPSGATSTTIRPSAMAGSSLSGGAGLSYHPTAGHSFTDPAIVSMASSTLGPAPLLIGQTGVPQLEMFPSSGMPAQRQYLSQGPHSSQPMSFSTWDSTV